ncbi:hypothetical protein V5738_12605 [Salinisphaera sp. SPP-AMP-43]|uniref:hypothetical protein n=1 Tax=Salinisphaera sp. SPP-AMP-43 TaxID=3121288 RepID=UPI003C6DE362
MLRSGLAVLGIILSSGVAVAAPSAPSEAGGPPKPPPNAERPPPPPPGGADKGFQLDLGHGRGLRVQCGNESLQDCIKSAQPLIEKLRQAPGKGMAGAHHRWPMMGPQHMMQPHPGVCPGMPAKPAGGARMHTDTPSSPSKSEAQQP